MRDGRGDVAGQAGFARYPASTFSTVPQAVARAMAERRVGRNGWAVMTALCRTVLADGRFGVVSAEKVSEYPASRGPRWHAGCPTSRRRRSWSPL